MDLQHSLDACMTHDLTELVSRGGQRISCLGGAMAVEEAIVGIVLIPPRTLFYVQRLTDRRFKVATPAR